MTTVGEFPLRFRSTPDGVDYSIWGPEPATPAPTVFCLTGTRTNAFEPDFVQAMRLLAPLGWVGVAVDLPRHGPLAADGYEELAGWARHADEGIDVVTAQFLPRMRSVVDDVVATGLADSNALAATGTSRGGFLALRYQAHDTRIAAGVAYAPVTDLRRLSEFAAVADNSIVDAMNLRAHVRELAGRPVLVVIGDVDDRVGTDAAIGFVRDLTAETRRRAPDGMPVASRAVLHVASQPLGHTTPPGADRLAADWLHRTVLGRERVVDQSGHGVGG